VSTIGVRRTRAKGPEAGTQSALSSPMNGLLRTVDTLEADDHP